MSLRCPTVAHLLFTFEISPFCDVAQTSDCGISFKALYVMLLRRPTVAFLLKPFTWCHLDAGLWQSFYLFTFRGVTPDTRSVFSCLLGFREDYRPTSFLLIMSCKYLLFEWALLFLLMTHSCMHLLYLLSELSCEYFQSTHLACWFGQMLTKAISWMKNLIASPTPRGIPVSLVRPWIWSLYYIRFRYQISILEPHSDARWVVVSWNHITRFAMIFPPPLLS